MTIAPRSVSISATVDFPAPIPPVKPTSSTVEDSTGRPASRRDSVPHRTAESRTSCMTDHVTASVGTQEGTLTQTPTQRPTTDPGATADPAGELRGGAATDAPQPPGRRRSRLGPRLDARSVTALGHLGPLVTIAALGQPRRRRRRSSRRPATPTTP